MLESGEKAIFGAFGMETVEVVGALLTVKRAVADHDVGESEDSVSDRYSSFLHTGPAADPIEESGEKSSPAIDPCCGPCRLHQNSADVTIAFAGAAGVAFSRALTVARTNSAPTGQMSAGGEPAHIGSDLRNEGPGRNAIHAGNFTQPVDQFGMRLHSFTDALFQQCHFGGEPVQFLQ